MEYYIYIDNNKNNERDIIKLSRFYKICFFTYLSQYDILLYIDARISIKKKLDGMLETLDGFDIVFVKHYARNNINEEFKEVLQLGLENSKVINKIKHRYKEANYNYDNGLYVGRFFLFRNNENTVKFFMNWWNEVKNYSHRDQLSLNFVLKNNSKLKYNVIQYNEALKYFKLRKRKTERPKFK